MTQNQYLISFRNSAIVSVCVALTMVTSYRAGADAVPEFGGSGDRRVSDQPHSDSLLFVPLFKTFSRIHDKTGIAAPPLIIYAFLMGYYIAGLTAGATKG